jgi:hypothetical protein
LKSIFSNDFSRINLESQEQRKELKIYTDEFDNKMNMENEASPLKRET